MKKLAALSFLLTTFYLVYAQKEKSAEEKNFAGLDTGFARVLNEWHAAGFAVAVVEKDKVVYAKGFGYRDYENKIPVTPNTLFAIGSCTKAFTAALLGLLAKEGKADLDKPVRTYIPELKFYNNELNDKVTLRDMMCHRTGLPRHDYSWYLFQSHSKDSLMQRIQYMEPSAGLREKWQYNNFMFLLQGIVTERLTGKSWEDNIRERIFKPLGMTNSDVSLAEWIKSNDAAKGYDVRKDSIIHRMDYYDIAGMAPAGSINSSVNDMAKWVTVWINGGDFNNKEFLPSNYVTEAMSSQMVISGNLPSKNRPDIYLSNYGFGWVLSSYRGHYRVEHNGNIDGFSASTSFFPSDSIGIIVLCNQNGSAITSVVRNLVADRMLGLKYFDWETDQKRSADKVRAGAKEAQKNMQSNKIPNTQSSHALKDYEGLYTNNGYGCMEVSLQKDSLFITAGTHVYWLRHYHYDVFEALEKDQKEGIDTTGNAELKIQFNMNESGNIDDLSTLMEPALKPLVFTRTEKTKKISKDSLEKYIGEYEVNTVVLKTYTKDEKTLYLHVPAQPDYELVPVEKDKFSLKGLTGFTIQFNRDNAGEVTELLSIQPNGTFKATKKK